MPMCHRTESDVALLREAESVEWEAERRGQLPPDLGRWLARHRPEYRWDYRHMRCMQAELDRMTTGDNLRLLLEVAGRHGKTEHVLSYGAYSLDRKPETRVIFLTHSDDHARDMSLKIRGIASQAGVAIPDRQNAGKWYTAEGGYVQAVGIGASTASFNADLILIDDPIGKRAQAESFAERERVWLSITTDILARAEPQTRVLFSMPRWHHDDPSGRLQSQQGKRWRVVSLPGRAEDNDPLGRKPGEVLWPEMRDEKWHDGALIELTSYGYASFVQCRPSPREGMMFKWPWIKDHFVETVPRTVRGRVRYWDTAGTEGGGDFTAGVRVSRGTDGLYYIEHVERGQWAPGFRDLQIRARSFEDQKAGPTEIGIEQEAGVGGEERTRAIVGRLSGLTVFTTRPGSSKELRADPVASQMEVGNVRIVKGDWNTAFLDELLAFPGGVHDDQVDAMAGSFARLARPSNTPVVQTVLY